MRRAPKARTRCGVSYVREPDAVSWVSEILRLPRELDAARDRWASTWLPAIYPVRAQRGTMPALPTAKEQRGQSRFRWSRAGGGQSDFRLRENWDSPLARKLGQSPLRSLGVTRDGGAVEGLLASGEALTRGGSLW